MFHHHLHQHQHQQQQQQQGLLLEAEADQESSMSNLTSSAPTPAPPPPPPQPPSNNKRKRSLPGNPDPEAEVVALSPATLMATNRFLCEICGKGFQRDQNLQLHRRGHNLPWKLKQRNPKDVVRKKVYICPEATCVHHDAARALGDLTGIKKHFFRKHGEKKWKCDKCSKKYAVQSDWKAHSKICGTREYKCDCGTIFSRRDSFITHRAFCDALTEESAKVIGGGGLTVMAAATAGAGQHHHHHHALLFSPQAAVMSHHELAALHEHHQHQEAMQQHQQPQQQQMVQCVYGAVKPEVQPWHLPYDHHHPLLQPLCTNAAAAAAQSSPTSTGPPPPPPQQHHHHHQQQQLPSPSAHLSATALLQKAAQMGATISGAAGGTGAHYTQMAAATAGAGAGAPSGSGTFGLGLSCLDTQQQDVMGQLARSASSRGGAGDDPGAGRGSDGMTRDFLGLRALSHRDILGLAGFDSSCMPHVNSATATAMSCYEPQQHAQSQQSHHHHHQQQHQQQQGSNSEPWHG